MGPDGMSEETKVCLLVLGGAVVGLVLPFVFMLGVQLVLWALR